MKTSFRLILLLFIFSAESAAAQQKKTDLSKLEAYIENAREQFGIPGMAVAIVKDDSLVFAKGFGVRENGKTEKVDINTNFAIASLSKAFTATAVGMLQDQNKLKLDDNVTTHLPWFKMYDPYVTREITVRDLMCHRSG